MKEENKFLLLPLDFGEASRVSGENFSRFGDDIPVIGLWKKRRNLLYSPQYGTGPN
jgi:hypothetical protein